MPSEKRSGKNKLPEGVLDFETDPFKYGRVPEPFAACIYFGDSDFALLWDTDSKTEFILRVVKALKKLPPCIIYAHNGGKFDYHYLLPFAKHDGIVFRNGRIVKMLIGDVILKDSFPLMPFALAEFRKTKIKYSIFEKRHRDKPHNRELITNYLIDDCRDLLELLTGFKAIVGDKDTIGSAAFYQMRQLGLDISSMNESHDEMFRPYYFGGRTQAFSKGVFTGKYKYLDINSAYPYAMRFDHPHGGEYTNSKKLPSMKKLGPQFINCIAESSGALPFRGDDLSLTFPCGEFEFFATGWEIKAGIETGTLKIKKIIDVWKPSAFINFSPYVDKFFALRQQAKRNKDQIGTLAYKFLLNSGYGKFAQNPREFREYCLAPIGKNVRGYDWENDFGEISIWSRPSYRGHGFYDVCTGASITGFVRALLWRSICQSKRVLYVDTDSMICKASTVPQGSAVGQWKLEGYVKRVAIAGKKIYGVEWAEFEGENRYKIASKGARLSFAEILELCKGNAVEWHNDAPTFTLGNSKFLTRRIVAT